jgi:iron complex outermembrane receptor protein
MIPWPAFQGIPIVKALSQKEFFQMKLKSMPAAILRVLAGSALSAAIVPAMAQQAGEAAAPQRVVVTGSMISRADAETPSPVQVLTADDMAKSGFTTVAEVLANLTSNGQGALSQGFSGAFAGGGSGVSLRGLTVGLTLVLIDGHRMAPYPLSDDGQRAFVDVSSIPFDAVERIEVLKDGASSIYGSDAIAGVVNVILKKSFNGTTVSAEGGSTQHGGGNTVHLALTHGTGDLAADGYNVFGSLEYRRAGAIKIADRDGQAWANGDWSKRGGINLAPGVPNALNAGRTAASSPFLYDQTGTGGAGNPANFKFLDANCDFAKYTAGGCAVRDTVSNLQPETHNLNLLLGASKALGEDWTLNLKASLFSSEDKNNRGLPLTYPAGSFAGNIALVPGQPAAIVNVIPSFLMPASYPGNTFGKAVRLYGYIPDLAPRNSTDTQSTALRVAADLSGEWRGWSIGAALGYSKVTTDVDYTGYIDRSALYAALTRAASPFKLGGGNSAEDMARIAPAFSNRSTDALAYAELRAGRDLAALPGGALGVSGGISMTHKKLDAPSPALLQQGVVANGSAYAFGKETNSAAFAELNAPLLKSLEANVSGRYDHFDTYGQSFTPKAGFKFTPLRGLSLRGTFAKGFRAPNGAENGTAGSAYLSNAINDPILCADGNPKTKGNVVAACGFSLPYVQQTNKDLQPEKSKSTTLGMILEPGKGWATTVDYYNIKVNNQINTASGLPDFVPQYVRGPILPTAIADGNGGTIIAAPPVGQIAYAPSTYLNTGSTQTTGVELDTSYKFKLGDAGTIKAGLQFNHMISYLLTQSGVTYQLAGTHGPSVISGNTGNPKNRGQFTLGYDRGPLNVTTTLNWIGDYSILDPSVGANDCATASNEQAGRNYYFGGKTPLAYCQVPSFVSTDLTLTYKLDAHWTLHGTVLNLFDRAPPFDLGTYGNSNAITSYNATLHQAGAVGRFFSVGAAYRF